MTIRISRALLTLLALCIPILAHAAKFASFWQLAENQPAIRQGGRANTIAVHPLNNDRIIVASETGGLFKSVDHGIHWTHIDSLPVYFTQAVVYLPSNPNIVLVTAQADFKSNNGGGLWRSANGGATWSPVPLMIPGFTGRLSGNEISIRPDETIYVATSAGVFISADTGLNWTYSDVFGANGIVRSVLATPSVIIAGGPSGVRIASATTTVPVWRSPSTSMGSVTDIHALGRSPLSASQAFVVDDTSALFRTEDGGVTWTRIEQAPGRTDNRCGGIAFIKAMQRFAASVRVLSLYYGNRCWLYRLDAPVNAAGNSAIYNGPWQAAQIDHSDTRDLAFIGTHPFLLGTDGGLHTTGNDGDSWNFVGGSRDGYSALQVTEVKGQAVGSPPTTDIYFGTQDNNLWSTTVWNTVHRFEEAEGFYIEAEPKVDFEEDSTIAFVACADCNSKRSGRRFTDTVLWTDASGQVGAPTIIRNSTFIQPVGPMTTLTPGMALTEDTGGHWSQFAVFPETTRDIARLAYFDENDPLHTAIVYQPFRTNRSSPGFGEVNWLMRIEKTLFDDTNGTVVYPAMNGFGGLGINPTMWAFYQVYGIDPGDADHIIAPDVINQLMMETRDGGENWTPIAGLTNLVTDNGRLLFRTNFIGNWRGPIFPIVTAVSFSPQNNNLVLIGTNEGGIFRSNDNGGTWKKIDGTERATYITSFFWENGNTVHVSTYGRGLWILRNRPIAVLPAFDQLCGTNCDVVSNDSGPGPDRPPFAGGVLVYEGRVLGARTSGGQLKEVFVTPGSSVVFIGDQDDPQWDISITEAEYVDAKELESLPEPPKGWITKGLVFTERDELTGTVFGDSEMTLMQPVSPKHHGGSTESPTAGKPYIRLVSNDANGITAVFPGETFDLAATDFLAEKTYEIFIDGEPAKIAVTADRTGAFAAKLSAPDAFGYHLVEIRAAGDRETVIDASMFLVRHGD